MPSFSLEMQFRNTKILDNGFKVDVLVVCCGFNLTYNIILECQNQYIYFNLFLFKSKKKITMIQLVCDKLYHIFIKHVKENKETKL